jgi:hypothetical protein
MWFLMPIIAGLLGIMFAVVLYLTGERLAKAAGAGPLLSFFIVVVAIWLIGRVAINAIGWMPRPYQLTQNGSRIALILFSIGTAYIYACIFGLIRLAVQRFAGN